MSFAITQTCCTDASCVSVCPVNCIHPTPGEPDFGAATMLYIDPATCIDCGACADACPVDAISPVDLLTGPDAEYARINAEYYEQHPADHAWGAPEFPRTAPGLGPLRVAIVGTGPSASYAAQELLRATEAEVTLIDRLPVPGGLVRHGVAPDHPSTKKVGDTFAALYRHPRVRAHLGIEVGRDVAHDELLSHHHAVLYAVGAATDRTLGIPGEDLHGSLGATRVVGWYNAHPDVPADAVELAGERAVVVGTGNVALDVARILAGDPEALAATDIADHALERLRHGAVREVVVLGRRGPDRAAWTRPELRALTHLPGVELVVDDDPATAATIDDAPPGSHAALLAGVPRRAVDLRAAPDPGRRIVLRFGSSPTAILGDERVAGVRVERGGLTTDVPAGLVVRAIGHRGTPLAGLPFDDATGTMPHDRGRVADGTYVVGWAKRGPSGGIGTNRTCASETVGTLLDDAVAGRLPAPRHSARHFARLVRRRRRDVVGLREIHALDAAERRRGTASGRPRVKYATVDALLAAGRGRRVS